MSASPLERLSTGELINTFNGFAADIASNPQKYEEFLGQDLGWSADRLYPDLPVFDALARVTKETPVDEDHLVDPNFVRGAFEGLMNAREQRRARL